MEYEFLVKQKAQFTHIIVDAGPRYFEDATVNGVEDENGDLMFGLVDGRWKVKLQLDNGKILGWPNGMTADVHYKVCDNGKYTIVGDGVQLNIGPYVPDVLCPSRDGHGDYIIMKIDGNGFIENWNGDISETIQEHNQSLIDDFE